MTLIIEVAFCRRPARQRRARWATSMLGFSAPRRLRLCLVQTTSSFCPIGFFRASVPTFIKPQNCSQGGTTGAGYGHSFIKAFFLIGIYRQRRLHRALGCRVAAPIELACRSRRPLRKTRDRCNSGQYCGDLFVVEWNAQALLCLDPTLRKTKMRYFISLLRRTAAVRIIEAHGIPDWHNVFVPPQRTTYWCSASFSMGHASVRILVKD